MKVKKLIACLLAITVLLPGCGKKDNKIKAGILFASYTHTAHQESVLTALEQAGYQSVPMSANQDHQQQITQLSDFVAQEVSLVIIEPVDPENAAQLAQMLMEAEIPGIFIGQEPDAEVLDSWDKLFYVGEDETNEGYLQGQMIRNSMDGGDINGNEQVSWAVIRGPEGDKEADMLTQYCDDALTGTCLEVCISDGSREQGRELTRKLLNRFGKDVEVILCNSDQLALGAVQGVQDGGWIPGQDVYIVGTGGTEEMLGLIRKGTCFGTVVPDESVLSQQIAQIATALVEGTQTEKRFYAGYLSVTAENVAIFHQ